MPSHKQSAVPAPKTPTPSKPAPQPGTPQSPPITSNVFARIENGENVQSIEIDGHDHAMQWIAAATQEIVSALMIDRTDTANGITRDKAAPFGPPGFRISPAVSERLEHVARSINQALVADRTVHTA